MEQDFEVRSIRLYNEADYKVLSRHYLLSEAAEARKVSGDLVYFRGKLVLNDSWLFQWEKETKNCFAKKMIELVKDRQFVPQLQRVVVSGHPVTQWPEIR